MPQVTRRESISVPVVRLGRRYDVSIDLVVKSSFTQSDAVQERDADVVAEISEAIRQAIGRIYVGRE